MDITKDIFDRLMGICPVPPETGGIIGGRDMCISELVVEDSRNSFEYVPDVGFLNKIIRDWGKQGISFYGMFHSHPSCFDVLSRKDEEYIRRIMRAMPQQIDRLLFPLVLPGERIIPYVARREGDDVVIEEGELTVV